MASIATIKESTENVACDAQGQGTHVFTVTNVSGDDLRMGFQILANAPASSDWFEVVGENERSFGAAATDQVNVTANLPADASPQKFTFKLLAFSTVKGRSDEDYSEGPIVSFEKPEPTGPVVKPPPADKKPFPWWIVAVAVVVLLIGGGLTAFLLSGHKVPEVAGMTVADATAALEKAGLVRGDLVNESVEGKAAGTVLRTDPTEQTKVDKGAAVKLVVVELPLVAVPVVIRRPLNDAQAMLKKAGLEPGSISAIHAVGFPDGAVVRTSPAPATKVPKGSKINLQIFISGTRPNRVQKLTTKQLQMIRAKTIFTTRGVSPAAELGLETDENSESSGSTDSQ